MLDKHGNPPRNGNLYDANGALVNEITKLNEIVSTIQATNNRLAGGLDMKGTTLKAAAVQVVPTAGTRVQLPDIPCREVTVIGLDTNTGAIYVGTVAVTPSFYGVKLNADSSFTFPVSNVNQLYIDASVSGEGVSYVAV